MICFVEKRLEGIAALRCLEAGITPSECEQLGMRSLLHNIPIIQNSDHISVLNGRKAMRNDNCGTVL